jgi:hypothetical protein
MDCEGSFTRYVFTTRYDIPIRPLLYSNDCCHVNISLFSHAFSSLDSITERIDSMRFE